LSYYVDYIVLSSIIQLMVIGEAPGETEDQLGKPFVGKAGKLLDQILQSVNFDVEKDVYIR
jgi:uracil-DNA glycosylase family 4